MITITSVRVKLAQKGNRMGYADIVVDGDLILKGINIVYRRDIQAIAIMMPEQPIPYGETAQWYHPVNERGRNAIEKAVLDEFNKVKACK